MLEFTEVFPKDCIIINYPNYVETIMKCKNIDFGHTDWIVLSGILYDDVPCMVHIIDNIIDIDTHDNNRYTRYTFFGKVITYSRIPSVIHYIFNNGHINNKTFEIYFSGLQTYHHNFCKCCPHKQFDKLTNYSTKVSLNKFKGYNNLEKYYDMLNIMLLILKAQQRLPTAVIKHLIIPFIYQ